MVGAGDEQDTAKSTTVEATRVARSRVMLELAFVYLPTQGRVGPLLKSAMTEYIVRPCKRPRVDQQPVTQARGVSSFDFIFGSRWRLARTSSCSA
jgi:hypothetical protein